MSYIRMSNIKMYNIRMSNIKMSNIKMPNIKMSNFKNFFLTMTITHQISNGQADYLLPDPFKLMKRHRWSLDSYFIRAQWRSRKTQESFDQQESARSWVRSLQTLKFIRLWILWTMQGLSSTETPLFDFTANSKWVKLLSKAIWIVKSSRRQNVSRRIVAAPWFYFCFFRKESFFALVCLRPDLWLQRRVEYKAKQREKNPKSRRRRIGLTF